MDKVRKLKNILVSHCKHLFNRLKHDKVYQALLEEFHTAKKGGGDTKAIGKKLNAYRESIGLSKSGLESYIAVWQHRHKHNIYAHQSQKEVERVMAGVNNVLFGNGKELHFRQLNNVTTLCSKSKSGLEFDRDKMQFQWVNKEVYDLEPIDPNNEYLIRALYPNGTKELPISYCEIKRMMFPNGWHYYLNIYVRDRKAPAKHTMGSGRAGIDPGTSTMAISAEQKVMLRELAPKAKEYAKRLKSIQKSMDRSKRASNPNNYNPDGTIKKGRKRWVKSKRYLCMQRKLKSLYRQKAAYVRQSHCVLANEILSEANRIFVEHMDYKALQRRSKTTEKQDRLTTVTDSAGNTKSIHKYKRKKRFGKSLGSRAPSEFLTILKQKIQSLGGKYKEIDTKAFKASQYDHTTGKCTPTSLNTRFKTIGGTQVQRDLYSAFLIQHSKVSLDSPNRHACTRDFNSFIKLQFEEIHHLKTSGQSMPACFGF